MPRYDPRPLAHRIPNVEEHERLRKALEDEHQRQLDVADSGVVAKYGSTCLLHLVQVDTSDSNTEEDEDSGCELDSDDNNTMK